MARTLGGGLVRSHSAIRSDCVTDKHVQLMVYNCLAQSDGTRWGREDIMAVYEGWTFAAARGASRRTLHEVADAVKVAPAVLGQLEQARDVDLGSGAFDVAFVERVLELYARLGFHIWPRSFWRGACVRRVQ
jgi:hypothetical protein